MESRKALLYEELSGNKVRCNLCAHRCVILDGRRGICQVRENRDGTLYTLVYGRIISQNIEPVEKKPLFHFHPGSMVYSIATPGCNFRCQWCQNWEISQLPREQHLVAGYEATPEQIVAAAQRTGCRSIAYTYTEPTIFFEYAYDTARLAHMAGLANIYVTNCYMTTEMLETFQPYLNAANVDLKAFRDETYRRFVGARLQPVLDSLKQMKAMDIWLEGTTLVIPGSNDAPAELLLASLSVSPMSRFFPAYKINDVPPTSLKTLCRAREIGLEAGLYYVYIGNVPNEEHTFCHQCGQLLIWRTGYKILENHVQSNGHCPVCGTPMAGIGMVG